MRAIWKGSISFGLVNIPIGLYTATRREEIKFRLLRVDDLSPIIYKRVAEVDGKEVPWEKIVKGFEYEKGAFVALTDEDFERVDLKATQTVDITDFVDLKDINPMFFDKPYYLAPEKGGDKAYSLLRETLKKTGKVGILVLALMHFADELLDTSELDLPKERALGKKELQMAESLVESMSDRWDPAKYHDDYREALVKLIEAKIETGGKEIPAPKGAPRKATNVVDLASILRNAFVKALSPQLKGRSAWRIRHRRTSRSKNNPISVFPLLIGGPIGHQRIGERLAGQRQRPDAVHPDQFKRRIGGY